MSDMPERRFVCDVCGSTREPEPCDQTVMCPDCLTADWQDNSSLYTEYIRADIAEMGIRHWQEYAESLTNPSKQNGMRGEKRTNTSENFDRWVSG